MAFLRAREIEDEIRNRGMERGTIWCLQTLAEQQIALQKDMRELATLLDAMADIVGQFSTIAENMKGAVDKLNNEALYNDDMPKNTQDL
jgi:hypothetical protein